MPVAVMVFAVAAAFATQAKEVSSSTLVDAYIPMGLGQPCTDADIQCSTVDINPICKVGTTQVFGLHNPDDETSCRVPLYRP